MPCDGIDQCAAVISTTGVHDHAGGLINDQQLLIFIDDFEWNVFSLDAAVVTWATEHESDDVAGFYAVIAFHGAAIHVNTPRIGGRLNAIA